MKYKRMSLTLKTKLYEELKALAEYKGKSISKVLDKMVDNQLELEFEKAIIRDLEKNPPSNDPKDRISHDEFWAMVEAMDDEDNT